MNRSVVVDSGPFVAYLSARDAHHAWAVREFSGFAPPMTTCEPALTEACFLLSREGVPPSKLIQLLERGVLRIGLGVEREAASVRQLMERYADRPMSLADACLVRLAEETDLPICTVDGDFEIYRKHGRDPLRLVMPLRP